MPDFNFGPYLAVLPWLLLSFVMGLILTPILRQVGLRFGFSTKPASQSKADERGNNVKLHTVTISRLGEFAMIIPLITLMWFNTEGQLFGLNLTTQVFGIIITILMIGVLGAFDSKYNLSEFVKLFTLFFASVIVVFTGTVIDIHSIINLRQIDFFIFNPLTQTQLSVISIFVTISWITIVSTALSYVGGVDGLSEGTSAIAIMMLTLIGIRTGDIVTITVGTLCLGGLLGLLPYNFYPKSIMSEHLIYGYVIAILAVISEGKIATSLLILTIPLLDFVYVVYKRSQRYFTENPGNLINLRLYLHYLGTPEKNHLHHKMLKLGLTHPQIAFIQYAAYALLGFIALAVSGLYLTIAIIGSALVIVLIYLYLSRKLKLNGSKP